MKITVEGITYDVANAWMMGRAQSYQIQGVNACEAYQRAAIDWHRNELLHQEWMRQHGEEE